MVQIFSPLRRKDTKLKKYFKTFESSSLCGENFFVYHFSGAVGVYFTKIGLETNRLRLSIKR